MLNTDNLLVLSITPSFLAILLKAASEGPLDLGDLMEGLEKLSLSDEPLSHREARKILSKYAHIKLGTEILPEKFADEEPTDEQDTFVEREVSPDDETLERARRVLQNVSIESNIKDENDTKNLRPSREKGSLHLRKNNPSILSKDRRINTNQFLTLDNYHSALMKAFKKLHESGNYNISGDQLLKLMSGVKSRLEAGEKINSRDLFHQMRQESGAVMNGDDSSEIIMSRMELGPEESKMSPEDLSKAHPGLSQDEIHQLLYGPQTPLSSNEYFKDGIPLEDIQEELGVDDLELDNP